jgi:hypothetical protein
MIDPKARAKALRRANTAQGDGKNDGISGAHA